MSLQTRLAALISAIGTDIKAINTALATVKGNSGVGTVTWPGGSAFSNVVTVPHGLSATPAGATASIVLGSGDFAAEMFVVAKDATNISYRARASDGSVPAAGVSRAFWWTAGGAAQSAVTGWNQTGQGANGLAFGSFFARRNASSGNFSGVQVVSSLGCSTEVDIAGAGSGDVGGNYDAPNSEYVTPFAGIYHFDVHLVWVNAPAGSRYRLYLWDDSNTPAPALGSLAELMLLRNYASNTDDFRIAAGVTLPLPAGCRVEPRFELIDASCAGSIWGTAGWQSTWWSGHIVGRL